MQKHDVRHNHWHDTLIRASSKTADNSCPNKACVACRKCLPNIGKYTNQATYQNRRASPKDITEWNNDEIGVSEGNGCGSEQVVNLWESFMEFLHEDWGEWGDG